MNINKSGVLVWISMLLLSTCVLAEGLNLESVAEGGRLYDKWWVVLELDEPKGTHSAYPASGKAKGSATWRCKECHGWDYRGTEGAYAGGSHYTGIIGIRRYAKGDAMKVIDVLSNETHGYDKVLPSAALSRLANFVVAGQIDSVKYIDSKTKKVAGNAGKGRGLFLDNCARCHASDGRRMNLAHDPDVTEYVATIAVKNPWETLHKIRNGQPGSAVISRHMNMSNGMGMGMRGGGRGMVESMPAMLPVLSEESQIDLLAYLQTLPRE